MDRVLVFVEIAVGVQVLISAIMVVFTGWLTLKIKADVIAVIDTRLTSYLSQQRFNDYSESHAKEHIAMQEEITRLRDWKDQVDGVKPK